MRAERVAVAALVVALAACDASTQLSEPGFDVEPSFAKGKSSMPEGVVFNEYNRNYYMAVEAPGITWYAAAEAAEGMRIGRCESHLATVTSQNENDWIVAEFPAAAFGGYWIGGTQAPDAVNPADGWSWVTGEEWVYTNWSVPGEPNDYEGLDEESLRFHPAAFGAGDGTWNDQNGADLNAVEGYVVEYDCPTLVTGGSVTFSGEDRGNAGFNAHRGADTSVKGQAEVHFFGGTKIHIDVTCLSVWGDDAWLGGVTTRSDNDAYPVGLEWRWRVRDNGQGAAADQDQQGYYFYPGNGEFPLARTCALNPEGGFNAVLFDITGGNIKIH
jgi:hypothetical protein